MYIGVHVKYPFFFSDNNETSIFSTYFQKLLKHQIAWKSGQWEQCCSMQTDRHNGRRETQTVGRTDERTDRQTDMAKLIVAFSNFVNSPKNCKWNTIIKFQTSVQYITLALV